MGAQSTNVSFGLIMRNRELTGQGGFISASPLLAIALGPTVIVRSSRALRWHCLLLERHLTSPGERKSTLMDRNVISLLCCQSSRFEHRAESGQFIAHLNRLGTITVTPAGRIPEMRLHTPSEFVHCALDGEFTNGVLNELDFRPAIQPKFRAGMNDKPIQQLLGMLIEELESQKPLGRLYVDFLAHALASRYLMLECGAQGAPSGSAVSALPARVLSRVREKIEANIDSELTLTSLARESGYSRAHFLRMFRAATGLTPHQYVLELRLSRAKELLSRKNSSLIDVALSCGFSSQSHMTSVFRQHLAITPAEFRRTASAYCINTGGRFE
jgi:AraC family transcriptional regulator